jgi:hypothetical protein
MMGIVMVVIKPALKANRNAALRANLGMQRAEIFSAFDAMLMPFTRAA